ncbi:ThiF family adenylyltransferase [Cognatishimia activa]|uniref:ThiF family adenylyltransferase n=1 Tax=Cognatishimia activa TaxID=1715691 RepID=UPI00222F4EF8|nr:ThiF family adenylyltransferase [Cognatishimia activa]UZD92124.1 ThiF family adenylyltransferase [Cognatishimia activa]
MVEHTTKGQLLAIEQLKDISVASNDTLDIVDIKYPTCEGESLTIRVSIETNSYEFEEGGLKFRKREPLRIHVSPRFPVKPPTAHFAHKRFLGRDHVQWGDYLCLFQATDVEWAAQDGMFGFVQRLDNWLRDAARNQLDPDDAPLHPPIEYSTSETKLAVEVDAPEIPKGNNFWIGAAKLIKRNEYCFDISEWVKTPSSVPKDEKFAAVVLLNQAMPMEYPDTISKLISTLETRGVPFDLLFSILKVFALCQPNNEPLYFIVGAPMRRRAAGEPIKQHLSAWKMDAKHVKALQSIILEDDAEANLESWKIVLEWAAKAKTQWCRVYDTRPEVTFRRDKGTDANWFLGKKIALLGCGALGTHIGEYLTRAGVTKISLFDNSTVNPGILVRQQFKHYQVGFTKESALTRELERINPKADIDFSNADLTKGWPEGHMISDFDLIIDATASKRVAIALQLSLGTQAIVPPMLRCAINSDASKGIATLNLEGTGLGPSDVLRNTKLAAMSDPDLKAFAKAFWPAEQLEPGFQPEPGCSEPTFVGSAADIAYFASSFFRFASSALVKRDHSAATAFFVGSPNEHGAITSRIVELGQPSTHVEALHEYRVHLSYGAQTAIETEMKSNARTGSDKDETGGILLGEIDDALGIISIDVATGPPPDSTKSPELFECGIEGTHEQCEYHANESGNSTKFVGVWHTHPVSIPKPSDIDLKAMAQLLHEQEKTPRHVVMLIIGHAATRPTWRFHLFRRNEFRIIPIADLKVLDDQ